MADNSTTTPGPRKAHTSGVASSMLLDMADTTWRMFVPTIGLLMVGRHFDALYKTKPWFMLIGTAIGALIAALLIRHQITLPRPQKGGETK